MSTFIQCPKCRNRTLSFPNSEKSWGKHTFKCGRCHLKINLDHQQWKKFEVYLTFTHIEDEYGKFTTKLWKFLFDNVLKTEKAKPKDKYFGTLLKFNYFSYECSQSYLELMFKDAVMSALVLLRTRIEQTHKFIYLCLEDPDKGIDKYFGHNASIHHGFENLRDAVQYKESEDSKFDFFKVPDIKTQEIDDIKSKLKKSGHSKKWTDLNFEQLTHKLDNLIKDKRAKKSAKYTMLSSYRKLSSYVHCNFESLFINLGIKLNELASKHEQVPSFYRADYTGINAMLAIEQIEEFLYWLEADPETLSQFSKLQNEFMEIVKSQTQALSKFKIVDLDAPSYNLQLTEHYRSLINNDVENK